MKDSAQDTLVIPRTIPVIPETVILGRHSSLLQFWQLALEDQERLSIPVNHIVPRTVLNPNYLMMRSLIPEDAVHPLLYESSETLALRAEMVLDYLIPQSLSIKDKRMESPEGMEVINFSGKKLIFRGEFNNGKRKLPSKLTVNGIDITKITTLADGTELFELSDLLFDHKERILAASDKLNETLSQHSLSELVLESSKPKEPRWTVPSIPLPAAMTPSASQTHLWAYNQYYQDKYDHLRDGRLPKTILSPAYKKMESLVPHDDRHPLYKNDIQRNVDLRAEFLLDYLILESVDERDTRITQPGGYTVPNLKGENITFMIDNQENLVINGVQVEKVENLDNSMKVYHLADFLFDHSDIQTLTDEYKGEYNHVEPSAQPSDQPGFISANESTIVEPPSDADNSLGISDLPGPELTNGTQAKSFSHVPGIPDIVESSQLDLINLWRYSLRHQDLSFLITSKKIPMTILSPINDKMQNLVPEDSPHPLYNDSPESAAFRTEFLLDYLIQDNVSPQDTRITEPGGLMVKNLNGKDLLFTTDDDGNLMISRVPVEDVQTHPDGTHIYTLSGFLFDHKARVNEALRKLSGSVNEFQGLHSEIVGDAGIKTVEALV